MLISKAAIDLIVFSEVTSKEHYTKHLDGIIWPGGDSGATIGIGYDLGYQNAISINKDWIKEIGVNQVNILNMFAGVRGEKAHLAVKTNPMAKKAEIPFVAAYNVFVKSSLPRYARQAEKVYLGLENLSADAAGAIISLVYNRGTSLSGDRRKEMKALVPLVAAQDYEGIAKQFESMKRLWDNGLVKRRQSEADLVRNSIRQYTPEELVEV